MNVRNRELRVMESMGINIDKHYMSSVAQYKYTSNIVKGIG